jgi:carbonic anhydrase
MQKTQPSNDETKSTRTARDSESSCTCSPQPSVSRQDASRRKFLQMTVGGAVAGLVTATGMEFVAPSTALAQTIITPEIALQLLLDGNERFVDLKLLSFKEDLKILREGTSEKQQPFAAVLSCADSRVPVELIFDQTIGHIFVSRVAGNFITSEIIATLEYGAQVLGTKVILVMGHGSCGAVEAAIKANTTVPVPQFPGQISALFPHIQPALDQVGTDLEAATKANALIQAALLRQSSTAIANLVNEDQLRVIAAYYNIKTGVVSLLE